MLLPSPRLVAIANRAAPCPGNQGQPVSPNLDQSSWLTTCNSQRHQLQWKSDDSKWSSSSTHCSLQMHGLQCMSQSLESSSLSRNCSLEMHWLQLTSRSLEWSSFSTDGSRQVHGPQWRSQNLELSSLPKSCLQMHDLQSESQSWESPSASTNRSP